MTAPQPTPTNVSSIGNPSIPKFEGTPVQAAHMKISGQSSIEATEDIVISVDDRVRLVGEYRVTGVRHFVNDKGEVIREQILKPVLIQLCPFDPSDPTDNGIVKARP